MNNVTLTQKTRHAIGTVNLPGSKSISNRALIIAELAGKPVSIKRLSEAEDTQLLKQHISFIRTCGSSGIPTILSVDNAGTVARFLTAYLVSHEGSWLVTGSPRMLKRPISALVDGLVTLGAIIKYCGEEGFLPIHIIGNDIHGGEITIDTSMSSQFVTALLLIGPCLEEGLKINFKGDTVSKPYIEMTVEVMKAFGSEVTLLNDSVEVKPQPYQIMEYEVEADWTSAAYWYEVAALSVQADIFIPGLREQSIQGDQVLPELYASLGVRTLFEEGGIRLISKGEVTSKFEYNFQGSPDLALSVITTCAALGIPGEFTGISHLKYKESDRLASLSKELQKIGGILKVDENTCSLTIKNEVSNELVFNTYNDHRLAMSFAPLVLKYPLLQILDADVVRKSYPSFWAELEKLGFAGVTEFITD